MSFPRRRTGPLNPQAGLCHYEKPDLFFGPVATQATRICENCPIIVACGETALRQGATDGVWAGVKLPGANHYERLPAAYERVAEVIARRRNDPPEVRRRCEMIRAAAHYAATLPTAASAPVSPAQRPLRRRRPASAAVTARYAPAPERASA